MMSLRAGRGCGERVDVCRGAGLPTEVSSVQHMPFSEQHAMNIREPRSLALLSILLQIFFSSSNLKPQSKSPFEHTETSIDIKSYHSFQIVNSVCSYTLSTIKLALAARPSVLLINEEKTSNNTLAHP